MAFIDAYWLLCVFSAAMLLTVFFVVKNHPDKDKPAEA
jgi:hypothetical protein